MSDKLMGDASQAQAEVPVHAGMQTSPASDLPSKEMIELACDAYELACDPDVFPVSYEGMKAAIAAMESNSIKSQETGKYDNQIPDMGEAVVRFPSGDTSPASNSKFSRNYDDSNKLALREKSVVDDAWKAIFAAHFKYFEMRGVAKPYLPHDEIMEALRPYLRTTEPDEGETADEIYQRLSRRSKILGMELRPIEPVSVSLEKCAKEIADLELKREEKKTGEDLSDLSWEKMRPEFQEVYRNNAKAVLDAAGVKYVD